MHIEETRSYHEMFSLFSAHGFQGLNVGNDGKMILACRDDWALVVDLDKLTYRKLCFRDIHRNKIFEDNCVSVCPYCLIFCIPFRMALNI